MNYKYLIALLLLTFAFGLYAPTQTLAQRLEAEAEVRVETNREETEETREEQAEEEREPETPRTLQERAREQREALIQNVRPETTEPTRGEVQTREAVQIRTQVDIEARAERLTEAQKERVINAATRTVRRIEAAFVRVETLANRLEERLAILNDNGVDVTVQSNLIAEARNNIADGRNSLIQAEATLQVELESERPLTAFRQFQINIQSSIEMVRSAHRNVVEAIVLTRVGLE